MELDADRVDLAAPERGRERERTRYAPIEGLTGVVWLLLHPGTSVARLLARIQTMTTRHPSFTYEVHARKHAGCSDTAGRQGVM